MTPRLFLVALALLACKPEPGSREVGMSSEPHEPTVLVEQQGEELPCKLVGLEEQTFEVHEHDDWLDLWADRELDTEGEPPPRDAVDARMRACSMTEGFDDSLHCTKAGRQVLAVYLESEVSILVVEERADGVRSIELSRWPQMCRCDCGSQVKLLGREPLRVVVAEYESVASEVHSEGEEIVEGCDEDDECMTACLGEIYGRQRVLEFGASLDVQAGFFDDTVRDGGEFGVRFELDHDRLVANGECSQVLSD